MEISEKKSVFRKSPWPTPFSGSSGITENPTCHASYSDGTPSQKLRELLSENPWLEDETFFCGWFLSVSKGYVVLC